MGFQVSINIHVGTTCFVWIFSTCERAQVLEFFCQLGRAFRWKMGKLFLFFKLFINSVLLFNMAKTLDFQFVRWVGDSS